MKLSLIFLLFSFTSGFAQHAKTNKNDSFFLRGKLVGRDTGRIVLRYVNSHEKWVADTTYLEKGNFKFKGEINQPTYAGLKGYPKEVNFNEVNYVGIFLEPTSQTISLIENNYENAIMKGSQSQGEYDSLKMKFDSIELKWKIINDEYLQLKRNIINHSIDDSLSKIKFDSLKDTLKLKFIEAKTIGLSFIAQHPNSYVSAYFLGIYLNRLSIDSAKFLYSKFAPRVKSSRYGLWDETEIKKIQQSSMGVTASNFTVKDVKGKEISLYLLKDKFVLLNFWASWCVPCREEIPFFKKLYKRYHIKGFEIIAISIDKDIKAWKKTIEKENISNWYNVLANENIIRMYPNVNQPIPSQILIDKKGKIVWRSNDKSIKNDLESVLKKQIQ